MNVTESNHLTKLLRFMLDPTSKVPADQAAEAATYLADRANRTLLTGPTAEQLRDLFAAYVARRDDQAQTDEAACQVCGCTENHACEGGCWWVPNPLGVDLCSACVHSIAALADGEAAAEALADQTLMKGLTVEDGAATLSLIPPREIAALWVHCARGMLGDAVNYSETRVDLPSVSMEVGLAGEFERFTLIVQRVGKLTPHEARQQAEAERDQLRADLERATERLDELSRRYAATNRLHPLDQVTSTCTACHLPYPCPTVRTLDKPQPEEVLEP